MVLLLVAFAAVESTCDEPQEIELDQIWGCDLPGTRDVAAIPLPEESEQLRKDRENNIWATPR